MQCLLLMEQLEPLPCGVILSAGRYGWQPLVWRANLAICTSGCGHWIGAGELQFSPIDVISADSSPTERFPCVKMSLTDTAL